MKGQITMLFKLNKDKSQMKVWQEKWQGKGE